jgi:acyl-CoA hydrolase
MITLYHFLYGGFMENYKLVLPQHLNHYGYLFGGYLLQWVDETAWIAATFDYPCCRFVTIGMDSVEFRRSIRQGTILRIDARRGRHGNTSVQYGVEVFSGDIESGSREVVFSTTITFVRIDENGKKLLLPLSGGSEGQPTQ